MDPFKVFLLSKDLAPKTVKRHLTYGRYLLTACPNFSFEEIDVFFASHKLKGNKNTYINHMIPTLRLYAEFKGLLGYRERFKYRKEEKFEKAVMSQDEVERFLALPCPKNWDKKEFLKATVFFYICFMTGLRPGECAALKINDIDYGLGVLHIRHGKTAESIGDVPIPPNLKPILQTYLSTLKTEILFKSPRGSMENGGLVNTVWWGNQFHKRCKLLSIKRTNLSAYSTRHTYGSMLAWEDVNLYTIKELMRHTDIKTTERYMHRNLKSMKEAQKKIPMIRQQTDPLTIIQALGDLIHGFHIENDTRFTYEYSEDGNSLMFKVAIK